MCRWDEKALKAAFVAAVKRRASTAKPVVKQVKILYEEEKRDKDGAPRSKVRPRHTVPRSSSQRRVSASVRAGVPLPVRRCVRWIDVAARRDSASWSLTATTTRCARCGS